MRLYAPDLTTDSGLAKATITHKDFKELEKMADSMTMAPRTGKLDAEAKRNQSILGALKWLEGRVMPRLTLPLHRASCVAGSPPPELTKVLRALLVTVAKHPDEGLTFGGRGMSSIARMSGGMRVVMDMGQPPPSDMEVFADSTWSLTSTSPSQPSTVGSKDLIGLVVMYCGAAAHHSTKSIKVVTRNSKQAEAIATNKALDIAEYGRTILFALGDPPKGPTFIGTDALSHAQVANNAGSAGHSKHDLRRYTILQDSIREETVNVGHIPESENPSDFLTKWLSRAKFKRSLVYVTNQGR